MSRRQPKPQRARTPGNKASRAKEAPRAAAPEGELARLRAELAEALAQLRAVEQDGADRFLARRLAELEEGRQVARGQAVEATIAKAKAEGELKMLRDAIGKAPGLSGWLLRRAQRRLG